MLGPSKCNTEGRESVSERCNGADSSDHSWPRRQQGHEPSGVDSFLILERQDLIHL